MQRIEIDILDRLTVEARNALNPPHDIYYDDHGIRRVRRPKPDTDLADLLYAAIAEIRALRAMAQGDE